VREKILHQFTQADRESPAAFSRQLSFALKAECIKVSSVLFGKNGSIAKFTK
jgi:hypothetical protein